MKPVATVLCIIVASITVSGCVAKTAASIITAPIRVTSKAVDVMTTSQSEADEKRGRSMRKNEERMGKLQRSYTENQRKCERGKESACDKAREDYAAIRDLDTYDY